MTRKFVAQRSARRLAKPTGGQETPISGTLTSPRAPSFIRLEIEPYEKIARLIAGKKRDVPAWFAEHLKRWAPSLFLDAAVYRKQPGRAEMLRQLQMVRKSARLLHRSLAEGSVLEFLEADPGGKIEARGMLLAQLKQLVDRAERALSSSSLVTEKGVTKAGRGRALPPGATTPEAYCAALIAEAWKYLRGRELAPGNKEAKSAAAALWGASGAEAFRNTATKRRPQADEPERRWRIHLEKAASSELSGVRAEFRRHMIESAEISRMLAEENGEINPAEKS